MWRTAIITFRPQTVRSWVRANLIEWGDLLTRTVEYVDDARTRFQTECLIDVLSRHTHISTKDRIQKGEDENVDEIASNTNPDSVDSLWLSSL